MHEFKIGFPVANFSVFLFSCFPLKEKKKGNCSASYSVLFCFFSGAPPDLRAENERVQTFVGIALLLVHF